MALGVKNQANKGLIFKKRGVQDKKKVMIYGNDGTGKSTYAEKYCNENGLKPVCIDIDDTNFTNVPIVEIDTSTALSTYNSIIQTIEMIVLDGNFDTIIIDGVTSLLEMLVGKSKGLSKYSERATRFNDILRALIKSNMNIIWIGQADMKVVYNDDHQSNKQVIKINSLVNEKYHCSITKMGKFEVETEKFRRVEA